MELLGTGNLTYSFLEKGTKYVSIIITIIGNITALVSHSVIFFGYFMPRAMVSLRNLLQVPPPPPPPTRFSPGLFAVLQ